MGGVAI